MDLAGRTLEERRVRLCEPRHTLSKEKAWADRIFRQWTNLRCARLWLGFAGASWLLWRGSEVVCLMAGGGGGVLAAGRRTDHNSKAHQPVLHDRVAVLAGSTQ